MVDKIHNEIFGMFGRFGTSPHNYKTGEEMAPHLAKQKADKARPARLARPKSGGKSRGFGKTKPKKGGGKK